MRPIEKGNPPTDSNDRVIDYSAYQDARGDMITRLGEYCSYCEMHADADLAIEHVKHKDQYPQYELDWANFLLSCRNCNSTKGRTDTGDNQFLEYLWPDKDNTFFAIAYSVGGIVKANPNLSSQLHAKADRLIRLVGLHRTPNNDPQMRDRRFNNRREAWDIAANRKSAIQNNDSIELRDTVVELALAKGYFSIWMTVFHDDPDMLRRLIEAFPGTSTNCFDPSNGYATVNRPGGQC